MGFYAYVDPMITIGVAESGLSLQRAMYQFFLYPMLEFLDEGFWISS